MAREGLGDPWVAWEAVEETEEASPQEDPGAPEGTPLEEGMSSTEQETGSVPIRMYFPLQAVNCAGDTPPHPTPLRGILPLCSAQRSVLVTS